MAKTKTIVLAGLFSALVFIFTAYIIHIPIGGSGGYIHFGDSFIFIAATLLPFPYALIVGAIGAGLADFASGAAVWVPFTIIIKPLMVLCFTNKSNKMLNIRNSIAPILAGVICLFGYYIAEGILYGSFIAAFVSIPGGLIQLLGSAAFFYLFAYTMDQRKFKERIYE